MPSLSSFLPTVNPGKPLSTRNAVMPRWPALGSALAKTRNRSDSFAFVIQSLAPVQDESSGATPGHRLHREGVAPRTRFGQGIAAYGVAAHPGKIPALLVLVRPPEQRVDDQCVLHVDHDGNRRVDPGQGLNGKHGLEESAALAAEFLRNLDAHQAEREQAVHNLAAQLAGLVHLPDMGSDLRVREFD